MKSGDMINNISSRLKKATILRKRNLGKKGVSASYIFALELNKAKKGVNKYLLYQISIALNQDITKQN